LSAFREGWNCFHVQKELAEKSAGQDTLHSDDTTLIRARRKTAPCASGGPKRTATEHPICCRTTDQSRSLQSRDNASRHRSSAPPWWPNHNDQSIQGMGTPSPRPCRRRPRTHSLAHAGRRPCRRRVIGQVPSASAPVPTPVTPPMHLSTSFLVLHSRG
jgi:hypothetical protein